MRPFSALMEKLRLRPQSAGPGRGGSGDEGGSATASDAADYSSPGAAAAGGSPCRHASAQAALERANSGDSSRTRSLKSIPVLGLMEEEGVLAGALVASSGARGLEPQRSAGSSVVPRGASLSYTDMLAFLDSEAIATKTASPLGKAAEGASDSEESDGIGSLPGGDHGSSACSHTASETGSEITRGLRHFKSIKVSHTYHHLRRNSIERKRDYTEKTEEEKATIMEGIRDNILFQNCPEEMLGEVVLAMKQVRFAKGKTIIRQGDVGGTDFFVLVKGICAVKKVLPDKQELRFQYQKTPQAFGELALLYSAPRAASIKAVTEATCWVLNSRDFNSIRHKVETQLRQEALRLMDKSHVFTELDEKQKTRLIDAMDRVEYEEAEVLIHAGETSEYMFLIQSGTVTASFEDAQLEFKAGDAFGKGTTFNEQDNSPAITASSKLVCYVLDPAGCDLLELSRQQLYIFRALSKVSVLSGLSDEQIYRLVPLLERIPFTAGSYVLREGELGDAFYIIESGAFAVERGGQQLPDGHMIEGNSFGGDSLLDRSVSKRTADVVCLQDGAVLRMAKADFVANLGHLDDIRNIWHLVALRRTKLFSQLQEPELLEIVAASGKETFRKGDYIIKQGEMGNKFYVIEKGACEVIGTSGKVLNRMDAGTPFGEAALLSESKRSASVQVVSDQCSVLSLERSEFHTLLGHLKSELKRKTTRYVMDDSMDELPTFDPRQVKWVKPIGSGAYAIVYLGWWENKLYAIKTINKAHMLEINQVNVVVQEKHLLQGLHSNFCIKMVAAAQDSRNLYLMLQPILGGELFTLVAERLGPLPEDKSRFYAACTVLGLEYLHNNNILYRDLKLENLLIDSSGYLKIADLGIAKRIGPGEKTYTFKGTPDYMAPEYLNNAGVTHAADWWALGVLIFEINSGYTPFQADEPMDMFRKIVAGAYTCPSTFSPELVNLLSGLLERKVARRLGSGVTGSLEVKQHPWFAGLDWNALKEMRLPAPWLPDVDIGRIPEAQDIDSHPVSQGRSVPGSMQPKFADF